MLKHLGITITLCLMAVLLTAAPARAKRRYSSRPGGTLAPAAAAAPRPQPLTQTPEPAGAVRLCGYVKPLRAAKEEIFVYACGPDTVKALTFRIDYLDAQGRLIHSRSHSVASLEVPPGEARRVAFATWDPSMTYYYDPDGLTPVPRDRAVPYTISAEPLQVTVAAPANPPASK